MYVAECPLGYLVSPLSSLSSAGVTVSWLTLTFVAVGRGQKKRSLVQQKLTVGSIL